MIHGLSGKLEAVSLVCETNPDSHWFASQFALAFISAGIRFTWYRRAADVHTAGILIYDPQFNNPDNLSRGEPLASIATSDPLANVIITDRLPADVAAPPEIPALLIGGRHILPASLPAYMMRDKTPANPNSEPKNP
jgi:hypothetical protein